jgi:hypothetical protein
VDSVEEASSRYEDACIRNAVYQTSTKPFYVGTQVHGGLVEECSLAVGILRGRTEGQLPACVPIQPAGV